MHDVMHSDRARRTTSTSCSAAGTCATGGCASGWRARTSGRSSRPTSVARPLLDGLGNEDEFRTDHDGGMIGMSFRFFDADTRLWSIYWADSRRCGVLDPPVVRLVRRRHRASSRAQDTFDGRPILVRFTWSGVDDAEPRWEQAFSADGGETWETNWIMEFTRAEDGR